MSISNYILTLKESGFGLRLIPDQILESGAADPERERNLAELERRRID